MDSEGLPSTSTTADPNCILKWSKIKTSDYWKWTLTVPVTSDSEEFLSDGRCALSSMASSTAIQWSWVNCPLFLKTRPKILRWNSNSEASPGQGRWPGTHPGAKMQWSYCHAAFQLEVTPTACALLLLNPHFPSSPSEEEASEVSKPWVHYTWGPQDTHCSPYSLYR